MTRHFEPEWQKFKSACWANPNPHPSVERELKRAFFAGALALQGLMMSKLSPDAEPTQKDVDFMTELESELHDFGLQTIAEGMQEIGATRQ